VLRAGCSQATGILLIANEVMTFRLSYHGAMYEYGIRPDLTCLGKIIGGGFPVGAVCGSAAVMSVFDHTRAYKVHHGGTFNANPVNHHSRLGNADTDDAPGL
jgi:glutamate-1-semialdehyde 2,1-aminomutase